MAHGTTAPLNCRNVARFSCCARGDQAGEAPDQWVYEPTAERTVTGLTVYQFVGGAGDCCAGLLVPVADEVSFAAYPTVPTVETSYPDTCRPARYEAVFRQGTGESR